MFNLIHRHQTTDSNESMVIAYDKKPKWYFNQYMCKNGRQLTNLS